jgi:hypothetical protein
MRKIIWSIVYSYVVGPGSNSFIGDPGNHVWVVVIIDGTTSIVGHLRSDLIGLLVGNGIRASPRHRCCITGPIGQRKSYRERVKGSNRPYEV